MRDSFANREQNVLDNVKIATEKTKAAMAMELETYKMSNSVANTNTNNVNDFTPVEASAPTSSNVRVRTLGSPMNTGAQFKQKPVKESSENSSYTPYDDASQGFTNSQGGNASTNTLLLVFGLVLVIMVFLISYCVFVYFGV